MAKGSGSSKSKGASVSGAVKAAGGALAQAASSLASAPIETFASEVMKTAKGLDEYNNKALISRVYDEGNFAARGLSLDKFKERVMSAHQKDHLELAKNDLGTVSDGSALRRSAIRASESSPSDYVFLRLS